MMDFEGIEKVRQRVRQNGTLAQKLTAAQMQITRFHEKLSGAEENLSTEHWRRTFPALCASSPNRRAGFTLLLACLPYEGGGTAGDGEVLHEKEAEMIKVNYTELDGPYGPAMRLEAAGHAGYAPAGQDIVCAGVSTLMQALVSLLAGEENAHSDAFDEPDGPRLTVTAARPCTAWVEGAFELAKRALPCWPSATRTMSALLTGVPGQAGDDGPAAVC